MKEGIMAESNLTLPDGTVVKIKGSAEEIAKIIGLYGGGSIKKYAKKHTVKSGSGRMSKTKKKGPVQFILDLKSEGFFKEKRSLLQVQKKLEEKGHIYSQSSIAVPLLRLVRKGELGRVGKKKAWSYVNR